MMIFSELTKGTLKALQKLLKYINGKVISSFTVPALSVSFVSLD